MLVLTQAKACQLYNDVFGYRPIGGDAAEHTPASMLAFCADAPNGITHEGEAWKMRRTQAAAFLRTWADAIEGASK